jgi:hypothetical protein
MGLLPGLVYEELYMSRAPSSFRKTDITRAYEAAHKAGHPDAIIEVDLKRQCLRIIPVKTAAAKQASDLDRELEEFDARHG